MRDAEDALVAQWLSVTEAQQRERSQQVKARGYPQGWIAGVVDVSDDPRVVLLSEVLRDEWQGEADR